MRESCPDGFNLVIEGLARFCAPDENLYRRPDGTYEPSLAPVFYNPEMVENRDITMSLLKAILISWGKEFNFLDPMAATGVRGIRFALEVANQSGKDVNLFMGDISPIAVELMKHNLRVSGVDSIHNISIQVNHMEANEQMYHLRRSGVALNYIDIDPFGTPAPYIHAALQSVNNGGIVGITATDIAVLEGKYPNTLFRRYGVRGVKSLISKEVAIRVLLSFVLRVAAIYDRYVDPLLSYHIKHYVRVFVKVFDGALKSSIYLDKCIGKMWHCPNCSFSYFEKLDYTSQKEMKCPLCGGDMTIISPLWICDLVDAKYVKETLNIVEKMPWLAKSSLNLITMLSNTITSAPVIRMTYLARRFKMSTPPRNRVIECIKSYGYEATLNMCYNDGINTNAPTDIVTICISKRGSAST
jgi:tRNA (guanine26-N2/guanine27-N2)-dimethyltransferase